MQRHEYDRVDKKHNRDGNVARFVNLRRCGCCRVPTLEGEKRVRVREGTQTGDRLRLRGLGFPRLGGYQRGDQFIVIRCRIP